MSETPPDAPSSAAQSKLRIAAALRDSLAHGYRARDLRADVLAGLVVGVVALPLSMALAIASGVPPQHGLYTAIVAGALIALLGGSSVQVSGPTAAFVVILAPISAQHGVGGLLVATMLAGLILMALGIARLGRWIEFIPYPVTIGFTAGIAVVIATLQLKDLFALEIARMPEHYLERVAAIARALPSVRWHDTALGIATLVLLKLWPRVTRSVPAPLVALALAGIAGQVLPALIDGFDVVTLADKFSYVADGVERRGIPQLAPQFAWPWDAPGAHGEHFSLSFELVRTLLPSAFAIALLGAIESLLSAVVADGLAGTRHDPDAELFAQGAGNLVAPFFGGIAATGAIARTATNVRAGARSPIAAIVHAAFVLAAVLALAPLLGHLPLAALAALLLTVAWNMSEARHFVHTLRTAPKSDVAVLLVCFTLTVVFDMVISVSVGVVLASLLFMRRMASLAEVELIESRHPELGRPLPRGVLYYRIAGPLFFGAAHRATRAIGTARGPAFAVVLDLTAVPAIDATGVVSLRSAIERLRKSRLRVAIAGLREEPRRTLTDAGLAAIPGAVDFYPSAALALAALAADAEGS